MRTVFPFNTSSTSRNILEERERLCDILDSGPTAYGIETGIWTSPLVRQVIGEEFGHDYHAGHVRKLLRQLGYSAGGTKTLPLQSQCNIHTAAFITFAA